MQDHGPLDFVACACGQFQEWGSYRLGPDSEDPTLYDGLSNQRFRELFEPAKAMGWSPEYLLYVWRNLAARGPVPAAARRGKETPAQFGERIEKLVSSQATLLVKFDESF